MNHHNNFRAPFLILFASTMAMGCSSENESAPQKVGIANPASEYCLKLGGESQPQKDAEGNQYSLCLLPDGTLIEEWELFRRDHADKAQ